MVSRQYSLPIYVLENGFGGNDAPGPDGNVRDFERIAFIRAYIGSMDAAVANGADVRGYFVWSLLDNFEWDAGYSVRFGLTYIDYANQRRVPKTSFAWYDGLIKAARADDKNLYVSERR